MSESDGPFAFNTSVCLDARAIAGEDVLLFGVTSATVRPLRRFEDGAVRSGVAVLPAGWASAEPVRVATVLQLFVRRGAIRAGGRDLPANGFAVVPAGGVLPLIEVLADSEVLMIVDEGQAYTRGEGDDLVATPDVFAIEAITPVIAGKPLIGFERRVLWLDPDTGADTRLLRIPGGFEGKAGPNWHPVQEEIFCLEGDIEPDDTRPMRPDFYLWNQANSVHGFGEKSVGGCVLIEWHDGPWAFVPYSGPAFGAVAA